MTKFGYKLMSEEHGPRALVENAALAEQGGFDFVSISDHFHPWLDAQGHAPFAWSVLGAIAQATDTIGLATGLTCPIIRYHPAIVAQAAATIAILSGDRFSLAVGAGERLNEHVTGARWPSIPERHAMLGEAIEIFRKLWEGDEYTHVGEHFTVDKARLYDAPGKPIPVLVGVSGPESVALAAEHGDGLMTTSPDPELVKGFRQGGKQDAPCYAEVTLAYAPSEEEGRKLAHERFRFSAFDWSVNSELPTVEGFETASKYVRPEDLAEIPAGPDPAKHAKAIRKYIEAGFDHVVLTGVGDDQPGFIRFVVDKLLPELKKQS
jgi:G6PDH family F420-dependent oxidoreductase